MADQLCAAIAANLSGEMRQTALDFVEYLKSAGLSFYRDQGPCWKDKIYYWVRRGEDCVCFIAVQDPDEPDVSWTVWSDDSPCYEDASVCEDIRKTGWQFVDYCGSCGSCGGGTEKVIFGRSFPGVCGCTFRVDNAGAKELPFLKTMVDLRLKEVRENR